MTKKVRGKSSNNIRLLMKAAAFTRWHEPDDARVSSPDEAAFRKAFTCYLITDYAWLADLVGTDAEPWINAVEAIDQRGDKKELLELLTSERPIPRPARLVLTDMLARYQLKPRRGRQQIAAYMLTRRDAALRKAHAHYKELRRSGAKCGDAIERAAEQHQVMPETLKACIEGKIPGYRATEKRLRAITEIR